MASEGDFRWYLDAIHQFPLLTAERERVLARRMRMQGDSASRDEMIRCNLRLVVSIARRYVRRGVALTDLVAEGNVGLVHAVDLFDPDKEVRFSTYATWWVRQSIRRALMLDARPIRLPVYMSQRIAQLQEQICRGQNGNGEAPADDNIASRMNVTVAMITAARKAACTMHAAALSEHNHLDSPAVYELLEDVRTPAPESSVENHELASIIRLNLAHLKPREALILRLRNGIGVCGTFTFEQIAARLGVTRERVRQIEVGALKKLSHLLQGHEYLLEHTAKHNTHSLRPAARA
ncbi:MAG: sigma-70 family RNA polymerase sigma factor [Phycisphaerae bacterium]